MLDHRAITKIQSVILVLIVVVASIGAIVYVYWKDNDKSGDIIKIGVCADLDMLAGKGTLQAARLAAEQMNAEGGILGKTIKVIAEDSDSYSGEQDITIGTKALTKLITLDKVDFIISSDGFYFSPYQDIISEHKKILFGTGGSSNENTQRVEDDYQKYKYFFRTTPNATHALLGMTDCIATLREYSGFNKIAWLGPDLSYYTDFLPIVTNYLSEVYGFEVVYQNVYSLDTVDFSSYLAAVESSGAEVLVPFIAGQEGIILVKDWYDRQSPLVIWGYNSYGCQDESWEWTEGKCEYTTNVQFPTVAGYPLTDKTLAFRDAYFERWGEIPTMTASATYDTIRYILYDAIERAGTIETEAVIEALEKTKVETSLARNFVFTSSHDVLGGKNINNPDEDLMVVMLFQWQNGEQVPMYPKSVKEEAGANYLYPPWSGPWDEIK
ncbi:MAG: ABC transporter substrate-binding protein [Candidatus Bathyarchaeota archaeon]